MTDLSNLRSFSTFTIDLSPTHLGNVFGGSELLERTLKLSDLIDTTIPIFDQAADSGSLVTGTASATLDGGFIYTPLTAATTGSMFYNLGLQFIGSTARENGSDMTYGFLPGGATAGIDGQAFAGSIKIDSFFDATVDYKDIVVNLPSVLGGESYELGTGSLSVAGDGKLRYNLFDTKDFLPGKGPNGENANAQFVVGPNSIDIILNPLDPKAFSARAAGDARFDLWDIRNAGPQGFADLFAPEIKGSVISNKVIDAQLDLDYLAQVLARSVGAGVLSGGAAVAPVLAAGAAGKFPDFGEISLLDTISGGFSKSALQKLEKKKAYPYLDAELVLLDVTANYGNAFEQSVTFDPDITYTIHVGNLSRTAAIHEKITFTDAELDALGKGETPEIEFSMQGSLVAQMSVVPVADIGLTMGQLKGQVRMGTFISKALGYQDLNYNYPTSAVVSETFPKNGLKVSDGFVLEEVKRDISYTTERMALPYSVYEKSTVSVNVPLNSLEVSRSNLIVTGTDGNDELKAAPGAVFLANDVIIMSGGLGDDILRAIPDHRVSNITQIGGPGSDFIEASGTIEAGPDGDTVLVGPVSHYYGADLGSGHDYAYSINGENLAWIIGGSGNDFLERVGAVTNKTGLDPFKGKPYGLIDLGDGHDRMEGGSARELRLGDGDDVVTAADGQFWTSVSETISAGEGDDEVEVRVFLDTSQTPPKPVTIKGEGGHDILIARGSLFDGAPADQAVALISGGDGEDVIEILNVAGVLYGDGGNDILTAPTFSHLIGGADNDKLTLTEALWPQLRFADYEAAVSAGAVSRMSGGEGDDDLFIDLKDPLLGRNRADVHADGGAGNDRIRDHLFLAHDQGKTGFDFVVSSGGLFDGGSGDDLIAAGAGKHTIFGGTGADILTKLQGEVTLNAGDQDDTILLSNGSALSAQEFPYNQPSHFINRGGMVTGTVDGGSGEDLLQLDLTALFRARPDYIAKENVTIATDYLFEDELDGGKRIAPEEVKIIYATETSGQIDYLDSAGAVIGSLGFANIEQIILEGMAEVGNHRFFARNPISVDASALGASHVDIDILSGQSVDSFFDPRFGVSGSKGQIFAATQDLDVDFFDGGLQLSTDLTVRNLLWLETRETSSDLHPVSSTQERLELFSANPGAKPIPTFIPLQDTPASATAPQLAKTRAEVELLPNTAMVLSADMFGLSDSDTDADDLFYRISDRPDLGFLALEDTFLDQGGVFSQKDLAEGKVAYVHLANGSQETDQIRLDVFDEEGQRAVAGGASSDVTLALTLDKSKAVTGTLRSSSPAVQIRGTTPTEVILTLAAPAVGTHFLKFGLSGPAAQFFDAETAFIIIEHGETEGRVTLTPNEGAQPGAGALIVTPSESSLGFDHSGLTALTFDVLNEAGTTGGTGGSDGGGAQGGGTGGGAQGGSDPTGQTPGTDTPSTSEPLKIAETAQKIEATSAELAGKQVTGLKPGQTIEITGNVLNSRPEVKAHDGYVLVSLPGQNEPLRIDGDFSNQDIIMSRGSNGISLEIVAHRIPLSEGGAVNPEDINGQASTPYFSGLNLNAAKLVFETEATAFFDNLVGFYEYGADGTVLRTEVLARNVKEATAPVTLDGLNPGASVGFFLVQDGANAISQADIAADTFDFVSDGQGGLDLSSQGNTLDHLTIFFSHDAALNPDSALHVVSGAASDGSGRFQIGFEDMLLNAGSDRDFQDVLILLDTDLG